MEKPNEIENIKNLIKSNSVSDVDVWFQGLENRKKEEILLHDKLRNMDFRKEASKEEVKKYFLNTKMLDGLDNKNDSLFLNNQMWFDNSYLV